VGCVPCKGWFSQNGKADGHEAKENAVAGRQSEAGCESGQGAGSQRLVAVTDYVTALRAAVAKTPGG